MATVPYLYIQPRKIYQGNLRAESVVERRFQGMEFRAPVDLSGVTFEQGLIFSRCVFREPVSFVGAHFKGTARFYKCVFHEKADFRSAVIEPNHQGGVESIYDAEGNFSWSRFDAPVDFYGTHFQGPVFFYRTLFRDFVKLESRFDVEATFDGKPTLVCWQALDFDDPGMFYDLHKAGLLSQDEDDPFCANMAVENAGDLQARLQSANWSAGRIKQALQAYSEWSGDMFSKKGASFQGANFASPEKVAFRNVSLKTCRFANSNAGRAQFQNVEWDRLKTFLWASGRRAVCDERTATSVEDLRAIGKLYCDLRANYEVNGPLAEASDFHYGELDAQRRSLPPPLRYVSLLAFYRYLSAYGERPGLALFWLLSAAVVIFPLLYLFAGWSHHPMAAVLHSLKILAFREETESVSVLAKVIAWAERGIVSAQAALLVHAAQRKLARK